MAVVLRNVTTLDGTVTDFRFDGGRIVARESHVRPEPGDEVIDGTGRMALPSFVEPHAHLDKALTADVVANPTADLWGAISAWRAHYPRLTKSDIVARASQAVRLAVANGVTLIRTHVDVGEALGLTAIEALLDVKHIVAPLCDIQICVLTPPPTTGAAGAQSRALARAALEAGADVMGGVPHADDRSEEAVEACLDIAAEFEKPIDLHADEDLDTGCTDLVTLCDRVITTGFDFGATASHCVSLGSLDAVGQQRTAELVVHSGVSVVTLPQTNLYLQARGMSTLPPRSLTAIDALQRAGVVVAAGGDNLRDPFNLMGRGDPCETVSLLVSVAHLGVANAFDMCSARARAALGVEPVTLAIGDPAELVCVGASSLGEFLASGIADRWTFHRGVRVCSTNTQTKFIL